MPMVRPRTFHSLTTFSSPFQNSPSPSFSSPRKMNFLKHINFVTIFSVYKFQSLLFFPLFNPEPILTSIISHASLFPSNSIHLNRNIDSVNDNFFVGNIFQICSSSVGAAVAIFVPSGDFAINNTLCLCS